jgi:hypothetical protein
MTVGVDRSAVETALGGGGLGCPVAGCGGRLAPWGWARARGVRGEVGRVRLRPRRSVCVGCRRTQVLLPASVLLRRADAVTVIGAALLAKAGGWGHRRVAARLGRPASTVRGWLRRITAVADRVLAVLAAARQLGGSCSPWRLAAVLSGGRLLGPNGPDLLPGWVGEQVEPGGADGREGGRRPAAAVEQDGGPPVRAKQPAQLGQQPDQLAGQAGRRGRGDHQHRVGIRVGDPGLGGGVAGQVHPVDPSRNSLAGASHNSLLARDACSI